MKQICKHFYKSMTSNFTACLYDGKPCIYKGNEEKCNADNPIDPVHEYFLKLQNSVDENSFTDIFPD